MPHLMLDCYETSERILNSLGSVNELLVDLCADLTLKPVMPPFLLPYYYAKDIEDEGISSFVLLKGGHVTFHTFPKRRCYFVDIFTERYFDVKRAERFFASGAPFKDCRSLDVTRRFTQGADKEECGAKDAFGAHIICRFKAGRKINLDMIFDLLDYLPQEIGMQPISRPFVLKDSRTSPEFISGMVLIAQSHIAFHYSVKENVVHFDLFSCSAFNSTDVINKLKTELSANIEFEVVSRGLKHTDKRTSQNERIIIEGGWINVCK